MPSVCVFAPAPLLTITIEPVDAERDERGNGEIHLHAGGQGYWIARMAAELGADVVLCSSLGGEVGQVVRGLLVDAPMELRATTASGSNGAYVHDRRGGERDLIAEMHAAALTRHEVDELYGATLVAALDADVCVLGGPGLVPMIGPDIYRRLTSDVVANGGRVIADLSGEPLDAAVEGGASVVKVSHEELIRDQRAGDDVAEINDAMAALQTEGVEAVVCTRAERPALARFDDLELVICVPELEPADHRGAGDSFTAGLAVALAAGRDFQDALRLGAAAGALNVTRHGLGSGHRDQIESLADHITIGPKEDAPCSRS